MKHLLELTEDQLLPELTQLGQPPYRARQVAQWVWTKRICDFTRMTDLPPPLRDQLGRKLSILTGKISKRIDSDDGVVKLLIEWPDRQAVECVLIPEAQRRTACLSTQVGCAVGCAFCASGLHGLARNLTAGEIIEQIFHLQAACDQRISNVVIMGMGEPLANYQPTVAAIRAIIDPQRLNLSARKVTLSTIGFPKLISRLAKENLPITLAISLHAPNDALRRKLIPAAANVTINQLIRAGQEFFSQRGRELTLEYVLLAGVNDSPQCADELIAIARQLRCNINLIPYNPVAGVDFRRPGKKTIKAFCDRLRKSERNAHIRASRGASAQAACGQLRRTVAFSDNTPA